MTGPQCRTRRAALVASAALILFVGMAAMPDDVRDFDKVLPEKIDGWSKAAPDVYTPENLSAYIDGGAELYLSYNFKRALSLKYKDAAEMEIAVDIFDMGTSFDAFGVFAHSRETIDTSVGQGSEYAAGLLTFWKGRYYVSVLAYPETPAKKEIVFKLGRAIAGAVPADGPLPPILAALPAENLLPETIHYFHHYIWLNSFYFLSNDNVLDIGNDTPAALAKYRAPGAPFFLLVVRYPDASRAAAAASLFRKSVLGGDATTVRPLKEGRWTGIQCRGALVGVVFSAPDETTVRNYLAKIKD